MTVSGRAQRLATAFLMLLASGCGSDDDAASGNDPGATASGTPAPERVIEVEYIAHAAFLFRAGDTELLIDPYASRVWLGYDWPEGITPDAVLITHPHYDHDAGRYREMPFPWDGSIPVVDSPGVFHFGEFTVTGVEGKHADPYGMEFGQLNTLMVVEAWGIRIAHLGDNGPLTAEMVEGLGRIDVLMLPADGVDHIISKATTADILSDLDPHIVIPMHYRLADLEAEPGSPSDLGEIDPWLVDREGVRRLGTHVTHFGLNELPTTMEYLVFNHAPYVTAPPG